MKIKNWRGEACEFSWKGRVFVGEVMPDYKLSVSLGLVCLKNDGRWDWFVHHDRNGFFTGVLPTQGVASDEAAAMLKVESLLTTMTEQNHTCSST